MSNMIDCNNCGDDLDRDDAARCDYCNIKTCKKCGKIGHCKNCNEIFCEYCLVNRKCDDKYNDKYNIYCLKCLPHWKKVIEDCC